MGEVLENPEYGSFAIFNRGTLTGFEFFESAASCLVYRRKGGKDYDDVLELNQGLGKAMNLTGQLTLDLMYTAAGDMVPIECFPSRPGDSAGHPVAQGGLLHRQD